MYLLLGIARDDAAANATVRNTDSIDSMKICTVNGSYISVFQIVLIIICVYMAASECMSAR